jgi:hypothetical protein
MISNAGLVPELGVPELGVPELGVPELGAPAVVVRAVGVRAEVVRAEVVRAEVVRAVGVPVVGDPAVKDRAAPTSADFPIVNAGNRGPGVSVVVADVLSNDSHQQPRRDWFGDDLSGEELSRCR